jgi:UDP-N-acetyl-2-amino-2-deoxyglucuronate dehydrogenase
MNNPHSIPITDRKIRFALVGCGRISKTHINAIEAHGEHAELVNVCDTDSVALAKAVNVTTVSGHARVDDLLEKTTADCVILATPSGLHPNQAIRVAGHASLGLGRA